MLLTIQFFEQALTSISAVFWFLLSEIQCRLERLDLRPSFTLEESLGLLILTEVETKFLCQVVETFNWPLRSNIGILCTKAESVMAP